jgi:hypothetical protein
MARAGLTRQHHTGFLVFNLCAVLWLSCNLFEPRDPEPPSQSGLANRPPTDAAAVLSNLQSAVEQKSVSNYVACFSDPADGGPAYLFTPSAEARAQYPGILDNWTREDEQAYYQNLVARTRTQAFSSLLLQLRSRTVAADSETHSYDYTLTFEHGDASFPRVAGGNLVFTFIRTPSNRWAIARWSDFKTGSEISWSALKGQFSN